MKKIGLYGGTFDPIHYGHLNLVMQVKEACGLDEVWLIPTGVNPFKIDKEVAYAQDRLAMTHRAAEPFPDLKVNDIELKREGISYAIDTLKELFALGDDNEYSIIIGDDAAKGFFDWKDVKKIIEMVPILVGRRSCDFHVDELKGDPEIRQALKKGMIESRIVEISSTEIRERVKKGLNCSHLAPPKVMDIIYNKQLYS